MPSGPTRIMAVIAGALTLGLCVSAAIRLEDAYVFKFTPGVDAPIPGLWRTTTTVFMPDADRTAPVSSEDICLTRAQIERGVGVMEGAGEAHCKVSPPRPQGEDTVMRFVCTTDGDRMEMAVRLNGDLTRSYTATMTLGLSLDHQAGSEMETVSATFKSERLGDCDTDDVAADAAADAAAAAAASAGVK